MSIMTISEMLAQNRGKQGQKDAFKGPLSKCGVVWKRSFGVCPAMLFCPSFTESTDGADTHALLSVKNALCDFRLPLRS